jgi:hypothetical protein
MKPQGFVNPDARVGERASKSISSPLCGGSRLERQEMFEVLFLQRGDNFSFGALEGDSQLPLDVPLGAKPHQKGIDGLYICVAAHGFQALLAVPPRTVSSRLG